MSPWRTWARGERGLRQLAARIGEHRLVEIEAEPALVAVGEELQDSPGPGAQVEQQLEGPAPQRLPHRLLDLAFRHVQRADVVPIGGMRAEIALCGRLALALQGVGTLPVALKRRVGGIDERQDVERELAAGRAVGDVKIDPAALAEALDEARFGQKLQVSAEARLALAEDLGEILDVELSRREQQKDAQARRLRRGLERGDDGIAGERSGQGSLLSQHDIKICLYVKS